MTNLHVVYRVDNPGSADEQWSSYSFPQGIYVSGTTLAEVRTEFREAAVEALPDFTDMTVREHLERPLVRGVYIRVAVDRRMLDRDTTADLMRRSVAVIDQRENLQATLPVAATGDAVVLACLATDKLAWVFEQMSDYDAVGVCASGPSVGEDGLIWWSFITGGHAANPGRKPLESLASAGLSSESTVGEFMRVNARATGRALVGA
ncbi:MAG: hypothetical protein H0W01_04310 [Pseudonocardiales bacterium]|nr:hypothetical protein [Pseudonocardiales bacterium]